MSRARPILRAVQRPTRLPAEQGTGRVAKRRQVEVLPAAGDAPRVRRLLEGSPRTVVLSGAGVSTDSGIPDYRSPGNTVSLACSAPCGWWRVPSGEFHLHCCIVSEDLTRRAAVGMPPHRPIQHGEFMATDSARRRYWARSMRGALRRWPPELSAGMPGRETVPTATARFAPQPAPPSVVGVIL